jgi:hypothetical protein
MDHRGNWQQTDESIGVPPVTVDEQRTVNVVNEQNGPRGGRCEIPLKGLLRAKGGPAT